MHYISPKKALKLGIAVFIMIIAISILLIWKSGIFLRASGYQLIGQFQDVNGLLDGAEVRYRGYEVGKVAKVLAGPENIKVYFWVNSNVKIPKNSYLRVVFDGLIGEKFIAVMPNKEEKEILKPNDILEGYATSGLADFVDEGTRSLVQTKEILTALRTVVASPEFLASIKGTVIKVNEITQGLNILIAEMRNANSITQVKSIISSLESISLSLKKTTDAIFIEGNIGGTITQSSKDIAELTKNLKEISEEIKKVIKDEDLRQSLVSTVKRSGDILNTISNLELNYDAGLNYFNNTKKTYYNLNSEFILSDRIIKIGIDDRKEGSNKFNLQYGKKITSDFAAKIGFVYGYPGLSLDYQITKYFLLASNLYNINDPQFDLLARYNLSNGFNLNFEFNDLLSPSNQGNFTVGISLTPYKE